jgi:hypothetical protein
MNKSNWVPVAKYKNEKPFTVFFSSQLHNDPAFPGLPIVALPSEDVETVLSKPWFVKMGFDFAVGLDGFDSDNWNDLGDGVPEKDQFVVLKKVSEDNGDLEVTVSNPQYVQNGNAVKELNALAWCDIPYPLPA